VTRDNPRCVAKRLSTDHFASSRLFEKVLAGQELGGRLLGNVADKVKAQARTIRVRGLLRSYVPAKDDLLRKKMRETEMRFTFIPERGTAWSTT